MNCWKFGTELTTVDSPYSSLCRSCEQEICSPTVTKNRAWIKNQLRAAGIEFEEFSKGLIVWDEEEG